MIYLRAIDELPIPDCGVFCQTAATVSPGVHSVTFDFYVQMNHPNDPQQALRYEARSTAPLAVKFSAEAAHEYEIRVAHAPDQAPMPWYGSNQLWNVSVVNQHTGLGVALLQSTDPIKVSLGPLGGGGLLGMLAKPQ